LQATKGGTANKVGGIVKMTVTVVTSSPTAAAKMPALNPFLAGASGQITFTGKELPKITNVILMNSLNTAADGEITKNFSVNFSATTGCLISVNNTLTSFTDASKTKPAVKGILEIHYEGFEVPQSVNVTIPAKVAAPKLALKPAAQVINMAHSKQATFAVTGGRIVDVVAVPVTSAPANSVIAAAGISFTATGFTVTLNETAKASNLLQLEVWLEGAAMPVIVKPTIRTTEAVPTYKLSVASATLNSWLKAQSQIVSIVPSVANVPVTVTITPNVAGDGKVTVATDPANDLDLKVTVEQGAPAGTYKFEITPNGILKPLVLTVKVDNRASGVVATVKADKGNIDLMNQKNTMLVYTPTIKGTASAIVDVTAVGVDSGKFNVIWNAATQKVEVRTKPGVVYHKGAAYKLRFEFELAGSNTVTTGDITIKPAQSAVKHNLPKTLTLFQSRSTVKHYVAIDLTALTPNGARIATFGFKPEKGDKNGIIAKYVNNPDNAYWYSFDPVSQMLHIWMKDGAMVKPGKATLVFNVTYEGQGIENVGTKAVPVWGPKQIDLKIPVTIVK